jgi:hypothetical protein
MNKPSFLRYSILALLLLFFAQTVGAGPRLSLTADEPVHMAQGYVYWTRGDFRMQRPVAQPPLSDLLPGAFLALQPGPEPETLAGWEEADLSRFTRDFVKWYGPALNSATFASRFPIALIALLGRPSPSAGHARPSVQRADCWRSPAGPSIPTSLRTPGSPRPTSSWPSPA